MGEERGFQNALRGPMGLEEAKKDFCKKFHDKTKNEWAERARFETVAGKYTLLHRDYGKAAPAAARDAAPVAECRLTPPVRQFVELICDTQMLERQVRGHGRRGTAGGARPEGHGRRGMVVGEAAHEGRMGLCAGGRA